MSEMLIGIAGKAGTGKSTLAQILCSDFLPPYWVRLSFADEVKSEASKRFGFPLELCYSQEGKQSLVYTSQWAEITVREILQLYGTDMVRAQDPDHWVRQLDKTYTLRREAGFGVVVDDVRFPNEADWVVRNGGFMCYLMPYEGQEPGPNAAHESETALDDWGGFNAIYRPTYGGLRHAAERIAKGVRG